MSQPSEHLGFVVKTATGVPRYEPRPHDFHRHRAAGLVLQPLVNPAHAALGNEPFDLHFANNGPFERIVIGHGGVKATDGLCQS